MVDQENKDVNVEDLTPVKLMTAIIQGIVNLTKISADINRQISELERKVATLCTIAKVDEHSIKAALDELFAEEEAEQQNKNPQ